MIFYDLSCSRKESLGGRHLKVPGGGAVPVDASGRTDMVGCDGISEVEQHVGVVDRLELGKVDRHGVEERRVLDVGRVLIPRVEVTRGGLQAVPALVTYVLHTTLQS